MTGRRNASHRPTTSRSEEEAAWAGAGEKLVPLWLSRALLAAAGLTLVAAVLVAGAHVDDRYGLDHVSGARMALAQYFNDGTLYPELFDGAYYGGTRWMPLPTILHGLLARVTGEFLVAGKLLSYAMMGGLLLAMLWWLGTRLKISALIAIGFVPLVYEVFAGVLRVPLPRGWFGW